MGGRIPPLTQETASEPKAGRRATRASFSASLHSAGAATELGWPERTQGTAMSQRLSGLWFARESRHPPSATRELAGRRWAWREGWRRSGGRGAAGSRPRGRDREVREPRARPGRREPGSPDSRRSRVLNLSPPREPEPPTNSARRRRARASVPERACGRAGWCDPCGARRGAGLARSGARKLGRGRAGIGLLVPPFPGAGTVVDFLRRCRGQGIWRPEPSWHSPVPWLSALPRSPLLLSSPSPLTAPLPFGSLLFIRLGLLLSHFEQL